MELWEDEPEDSVGGLTLSDFSKKYEHQGKIESIGKQQSQRRSFCHWFCGAVVF